MRSVKHGGKKGMRYRYKLSAVKRQNKKQKKKGSKIVGCSLIDKEWNKELTTRQNLATMGLAYDPNEAIKMQNERMELDNDIEVIDLEQAKAMGNVNEQRKSKKQKKKEASKSNSQSKVLEELVKIAINETEEKEEQRKRKAGRAKLHQNDIEFCRKMIKRHGEDYEAMSRDPLNIWQDTPKQIERKLAVFKRSVAEEGGK